MNKRLTVAIPTYNRSRTLAATLLSVAAQKIPSGVAMECVVVDNNSTDDTAVVVERVAHDAPFAIRRVMEPRLGSSFARNRAVDEATGHYILFIDDDALAEPDWANAMLAEIERRNLDAACGAVLPRWSAMPPQWLGPSLYVRLAVHDESKLAGDA
ncbi:MAG: glycosyltransferase family A protein, partial [Candidatus Binataceae bacterium]